MRMLCLDRPRCSPRKKRPPHPRQVAHSARRMVLNCPLRSLEPCLLHCGPTSPPGRYAHVNNRCSANESVRRNAECTVDVLHLGHVRLLSTEQRCPSHPHPRKLTPYTISVRRSHWSSEPSQPPKVVEANLSVLLRRRRISVRHQPLFLWACDGMEGLLVRPRPASNTLFRGGRDSSLGPLSHGASLL
ncbi:hypothetical protein K402DRAFT_126106 [Aulographum hederae CBS 113979]|uniref:Uncharacterized protein n=1 Tax=Aulographum hederae CBS 113979 TaxID=1176131 RepID=A0A6G1HEN2_9PEZI|nr:hypothetical protein K402DRAFT_126106 [Aulographum hederae CBS 113979]